jgi:hypothetical protein
MKTTDHPHECPSCHTKFECSTSIAPYAEPKENDVSLCWECGAVCQYNADLTLRPCDVNKLPGLDAMDKHKILALQAKVRARRRPN